MAPKKMKKEVPETPVLRPFFIQEILLRLPVRYVLRLKSLNKYYYKLISSQRFKKLYLNLNISRKDINPSIIFHDYRRLDRCNLDHRPHYPSSTIVQCNGGVVEDETDYTFVPAGYKMNSLCGCNGLVFVSAGEIYRNEKLFIVNPATKEYKQIEADFDGNSYSLYGLGYVPRNDEYKVVRVKRVVDWLQSFEAEVYTLGGLDEWKGIGSIKYKFEDHHGVSVNGLRHWVADRWDNGRRGEVIVAFDFVDEKFVEVALPEDPLLTPEEKRSRVTTVGELGGCLGVVSLIDREWIDVWIMQEYGVKESWSKSFTLSREAINSREYTPFVRLIRGFKNNNVLLQVDTSLLLYDPEKKRIRQLEVRGNEAWTDAEVYLPCLFSLDSLACSESERPNKRQQLNFGTQFVWQRPNKRETRGYNKVENYRRKLEEICEGRIEDDTVLAV